MKIVLYTSAASHIDDYSMHIWDYYCNFKRMANNLTGMDFTIEHGTDISTLNKAALNVLHISNWQITSKDKKMLDNNIDVFDLIICNNNMEHSMAMNADVLRYLKNKPVYLVMGSFLSTNHSLYNKVISFSEDWVNCMMWYNSYLSLIRYNAHNNTTKDKGKITYIGGQLRSWRKFVLDHLPNNIDILQTSKTVVTTNDILVTDVKTQNFINYCNDLYEVSGTNVTHEENVHMTRLSFGRKSSHTGGASQGYFIMPEYHSSECIIYPESTLVNNEVFPTEKLWKCVISNAHWIMFAGCNSYSLMKKQGLISILSLTPYGIDFDSIPDHAERYKQQMKGIEYIANHRKIFNTQDATDILKNNYNAFYANTPIELLSNQLDNVIEKCIISKAMTNKLAELTPEEQSERVKNSISSPQSWTEDGKRVWMEKNE